MLGKGWGGERGGGLRDCDLVGAWDCELDIEYGFTAVSYALHRFRD